jgi:ABC-2 type transport system permease protein
VVFGRELEELKRIRFVYFSLIGMPFLFTAISLLFLYGVASADISPEELEGLNIPITGGEGVWEAFMATLAARWALLYLLIPSALPALIAAYSVVGEKLARSLEPLLATPVEDSEVLAGKALAATLPPLAATYASLAIYLSATQGLAFAALGHLLVLESSIIVALILLPAPLAFAGAMLCVLVSARVNDVRTAEQAAVLLVVPLIGLFTAQFAGAYTLGLLHILLLFAGLLVVDLLLLKSARRVFSRETILTRWG